MPYVPINQAIQQNPDYVKQNYPNVYSQYVQQVAQPGAQLGQTQASTQETQAAIPGTQAESNIKQVQSQQVSNPINLSKDLAGKMTLKDAIKKYTANGGMKADDIFKQYLAESPWGLPNESPTDLKKLGISDDALGKVGNNGDFQDKWNVKQGVLGLRELQDKFHQTNAVSQLENTLGIPLQGGNNAAAYNTRASIYKEHLNTLIPGGSNAAGQIDKVASAIPDISDPREYNPGKADTQFQEAESALLNAKGYSAKDLGLPDQPPAQQTNTDSGHSLLTSLLTKAGGDTSGDNKGGQPLKALGDILVGNGSKAPEDLLGSTPEERRDNLMNYLHNTGVGGFNNAMMTAAGGGVAEAGIKGLAGKLFGEAVEGASAKLPSALQTFLNPKGAVSKAGTVRNQIIDTASKAGKTINGDDLATDIENWASKGKMGNLGQGGAIDQAVADAKAIFSGKKLDPKDVVDAYHEADSGYTKTGIPKAPVQANIDRGVRDIFAKYLDKVAPGWDKSTTAMAKAFQAEKSPLRKTASGVAKLGIGYGMGQLGFEELKKILPGI